MFHVLSINDVDDGEVLADDREYVRPCDFKLGLSLWEEPLHSPMESLDAVLIRLEVGILTQSEGC